MNDRRGIGAGPTPRSAMQRRRALAAGGLAVVVAAIAAIAYVLSSGGASPGARLAESFARSWAQRDWVSLYDDLDARSRSRVQLGSVAAVEEQNLLLATATGASVGSATATPGGGFSVAVHVRTSIFGTLDERFRLTLSGPSGAPKVRWTRPAGFPGLTGGERLRRVDSAPARGRLLARDGTPLSGLTSAANLIGDVAVATGPLLERMVAAGFPPTTPVGVDGLELTFQHELGGTPGGALYAGTRLLASAAPQPGGNFRTSISPRLQSLALSMLGSTVGGIVVMAPSSGEVLAAAGAPLAELQPPGSTFKIVTLTGVLEARLASAASVYRYATSTVLDGFILHNSNGESCGGTLANAFAVSCNSVFAPLGVRLGAKRLLAAARAYGFDAPSPVSIAAESTIPPSSLTNDFQLGESAIGQGEVLASPLQMAEVAATIALVGRRPVPTFAIAAPRRFPRVIAVGVARTVRALMRDVVSYGTGVAAQIPGVAVAGKTGTAQVATPPACGATGTTGTTRALAHSASSGTGGVNAPTGSSAADGATATAGPGGSTAATGATGSSSPAGGGSPAGASGASGPAGTGAGTGATGATSCPAFDTNPADTDAWFVGFAPERNPRFVIAVLFAHDGTGGATAAPAAAAILEQALAQGP